MPDKLMEELERRLKDNDQAYATREFIASIDWELLRNQYKWLSVHNEATLTHLNKVKGSASSYLSSVQRDAERTEGLLNLLDMLSDLAVDQFGVAEELVFGKEAHEERS